ncbi:MAG: hypothetical protein WCL11_09580 [Verrucomicrobiota bacterium]
MKPEHPMQSDQSLRQTLQQWKVDAPLPPRFQEQVWRRIELSEAQVELPAWLRLWNRLSTALTRPSLAASYVTLLLLSGVLAGYLQAHISRTHASGDMAARYVQMVSPFQSPHH